MTLPANGLSLTRARLLRLGMALCAGAALPPASAQQGSLKMNTRPIPSTQEALPVVGCGTWIGFDQRPGSDEYQRLPGVLDALFAAGGTVIDSSPMYGRSEESTGELLAAAARPRETQAFLATKVWTSGREAGIAQMEQSFARLRTQRMDLMQVHNLMDWKTHLATLRGWKEKGRVRYIGITHYTASAYREVEAVLRAEKLDFLQINYSLDAREAEERLLPLAAERGVAVIVNMPFGGGGLLRRLRGKPLPAWAGEIGCTSWAQVLLKFVLSQPAVTCTIPGTSRAEHMADNAAAGAGAFPDAVFWRRNAESIGL
ncbi:diketogulonate reductase-like aldo/keto reductase [Variovorax beijingensis]|uniref:Diketogulonate reductase-like aldo/keto reductase n=2 Tax=Comamonadaceae TaxID=80864 RepID=A0A561C1K9_9BURK|nr:aryl-alcohol dehydrogenase-like predicted oxidoreductase [Variovorax paradoxus]MDR6455065.1 aryl-alcohol dehydrogenase-like predicted oxidoreductase [Variovorax paradoxus]TWD85061.1 diketogulonate reductase-like aldo/keto reductase [Variovorax beijingensis]